MASEYSIPRNRVIPLAVSDHFACLKQPSLDRCPWILLDALDMAGPEQVGTPYRDADDNVPNRITSAPTPMTRFSSQLPGIQSFHK